MIAVCKKLNEKEAAAFQKLSTCDEQYLFIDAVLVLKMYLATSFYEAFMQWLSQNVLK